MALFDAHARRRRAPMAILPCVALASTMLLASCTTGSRATSDSFRLLFQGRVQATPAQVAATPYPQAQLKAPDIAAVIVLGFVDEGQQTWYAGNHAVFKLDANGLLTGTSGSGRQLHSRIVGPSPFGNLARIQGSARVQREYDWIPGYRMGVQAHGTVERGPLESVDILGRKRDLVRFDERLEGGMRAHNIYWADPATGFIWKSRQQLSPDYEVELIQLKPYRTSKD